MTRTIEGEFVMGKELDELARTKNVVIVRIKENYFMCEIDRKEQYTLQRCTGDETERYKVLDYTRLKDD